MYNKRKVLSSTESLACSDDFINSNELSTKKKKPELGSAQTDIPAVSDVELNSIQNSECWSQIVSQFKKSVREPHKRDNVDGESDQKETFSDSDDSLASIFDILNSPEVSVPETDVFDNFGENDQKLENFINVDCSPGNTFNTEETMKFSSYILKEMSNETLDVSMYITSQMDNDDHLLKIKPLQSKNHHYNKNLKSIEFNDSFNFEELTNSLKTSTENVNAEKIELEDSNEVEDTQVNGKDTSSYLFVDHFDERGVKQCYKFDINEIIGDSTEFDNNLFSPSEYFSTITPSQGNSNEFEQFVLNNTLEHSVASQERPSEDGNEMDKRTQDSLHVNLVRSNSPDIFGSDANDAHQEKTSEFDRNRSENVDIQEKLNDISLYLSLKPTSMDDGYGNLSPSSECTLNDTREEALAIVETLKSKILQTMMRVLTTKVKGITPVFRVKRQTWNNCIFKNKTLQLKDENDVQDKIISASNKGSEERFKLIIYLLGKSYNLLLNDQVCTLREIYYQLNNYHISQERIRKSMDDISAMLQVDPWFLPIISTSNGLVHGNLTLTFSSDETIYCGAGLGTLIPQEVIKIKKFESKAKFILIVEKDAIFKKLLDEDISHKLDPFILVTGKGFPDINTRLFVKHLSTKLNLDVYILVDADRHGIDIMLTYRFGSLRMVHISQKLAIPNLKWLGIHPSEIIPLNITRRELTATDRKELNLMLQRPYIDDSPWLAKEIRVLLKNNFKAEIEGVIKSSNYLTNFYLLNKFYNENYF